MRRSLLQHILRLFPAETSHRIRLTMLGFMDKMPFGKMILRRTLSPRAIGLEREVMGIHFNNPIGIAAGFDPDGDHLDELAACGFGFVEIGSVTPRPQPGTPRPRLRRLRKSKSLVNNTGAPSRGLEYVMDNIRRRTKHNNNLVVGCNIGKLTTTPHKNIVKEYLRVFRNTYQYVDFFVINIACNTAAKRYEPRSREEILELIEPMFEFRRGQLDYRPILLKISPDISREQLDTIIDILIATPLDGIEAVAGSTLMCDKHKGAICGAALTEKAIEMVRYIAQRSEHNYPIIGTGGMMTPNDIRRMMEAGASLVALSSGLRENGLKLLKHAAKEIAKI
ncbi:MAG: quinone-dependent dihydroorotate dehydrogenase [Alistipes sp.]|nr:quinone-dependent dihydroorotate dehydrogenase [Alistipes sp.]